MTKMKIFLSAPISAFNNEEKYNEYRSSILKLIYALRESYEVYSEVEQISGLNDYDEPGKSAINDFNRILESDVFMLHHPARMQTSALIELGYAYAKEKKIIIIADPNDLPYLALGLSTTPSSTVKIITSSELNQQRMLEILRLLYDISKK